MKPINTFLFAAGFGYAAFWIYQKYGNGAISAENEGGFLDVITGGLMKVSNDVSGSDNNYSLSLKGLAHIKGWEGFSAKVYLDDAGLPTIGYGHLIKPLESFNTITEKEASILLAKDVSSAENAVNRAVKVPIQQNQFDALVSFAFNVGNNAFRSSTLLRRLNDGEIAAAGYELGRWVFVKKKGVYVVSNGLVNRRAGDYDLFRGVA